MPNPVRILVVDDSKAVCTVVDKILRQCGFHEIEHVQSGANALQRLAAAKFDMIICDWEMEGMSGLDVLAHVRFRADTREIPFILMSAKKDPHWISEAKRLGANCMLSKPFNAQSLRDKIVQVGIAANVAFVAPAITEPHPIPEAAPADSTEGFHLLD